MSTTPAHTSRTHTTDSRPLSGREQQTLDTFNRHVDAFRAADVDKVLADFANDAIVITPDGVFEGKNSIRTIYEGLLAEFGNINAGDSPGILPDVLHMRDDTLFITWHAESLQHTFAFGTDTFVIEGSRIKRQTIAFVPPQPKA